MIHSAIFGFDNGFDSASLSPSKIHIKEQKFPTQIEIQ